MKQLTKRQKTIEASRFLKNYIKNELEPNLLKDLERMINNSNNEKELSYGDLTIVEKLIRDNLLLK